MARAGSRSAAWRPSPGGSRRAEAALPGRRHAPWPRSLMFAGARPPSDNALQAPAGGAHARRGAWPRRRPGEPDEVRPLISRRPQPDRPAEGRGPARRPHRGALKTTGPRPTPTNATTLSRTPPMVSSWAPPSPRAASPRSTRSPLAAPGVLTVVTTLDQNAGPSDGSKHQYRLAVRRDLQVQHYRPGRSHRRRRRLRAGARGAAKFDPHRLCQREPDRTSTSPASGAHGPRQGAPAAARAVGTTQPIDRGRRLRRRLRRRAGEDRRDVHHARPEPHAMMEPHATIAAWKGDRS